MDAEAAQRGIRDVVTTPERRAELEGSGLWNDETLVGRVTEWARVKPDSVAVIDQLGERSRTYAELVADAAHFAGYLQSQGVRAGDVVSIQLPNWYETVVVGLGVLGSGCVLNPLLPRQVVPERIEVQIRYASAPKPWKVLLDEGEGAVHRRQVHLVLVSRP